MIQLFGHTFCFQCSVNFIFIWIQTTMELVSELSQNIGLRTFILLYLFLVYKHQHQVITCIKPTWNCSGLKDTLVIKLDCANNSLRNVQLFSTVEISQTFFINTFKMVFMNLFLKLLTTCQWIYHLWLQQSWKQHQSETKSANFPNLYVLNGWLT